MLAYRSCTSRLTAVSHRCVRVSTVAPSAHVPFVRPAPRLWAAVAPTGTAAATLPAAASSAQKSFHVSLDGPSPADAELLRFVEQKQQQVQSSNTGLANFILGDPNVSTHSWAIVEWTKQLLLTAQSMTGLPWWATIIGTTLLIRATLFPLSALSWRTAAYRAPIQVVRPSAQVSVCCFPLRSPD